MKVKDIKNENERQRVIGFLKKYTSEKNIDDEYEITQNVLSEILDSNSVQDVDKEFLEGIMNPQEKGKKEKSTKPNKDDSIEDSRNPNMEKNLNNFLKTKKESNDKLRKRKENRSEIEAKIENHLKKKQITNMVKKSRNMSQSQSDGNQLGLPTTGRVENGSQALENAKLNPENMNKKMMQQILASEFPFPLIAYFYGNFMRDRPIKNYNKFLEEWERFIKNHGNKKVPFALASERFGDQPSERNRIGQSTNGNGVNQIKPGEKKSDNGSSSKKRSRSEKFRKRFGKAASKVAKKIRNSASKVKQSASKAAKKIRNSASKAAKKIRTSAMRRMGLNDAYNELMKYSKIPKSNIAEYNRLYDKKRKEMGVIMNKKYKQYSNQKKYDKMANVSKASIGYIHTFYSSKLDEYKLIENNNFTSYSSRITDFKKSALQYASSRLLDARTRDGPIENPNAQSVPEDSHHEQNPEIERSNKIMNRMPSVDGSATSVPEERDYEQLGQNNEANRIHLSYQREREHSRNGVNENPNNMLPVDGKRKYFDLSKIPDKRMREFARDIIENPNSEQRKSLSENSKKILDSLTITNNPDNQSGIEINAEMYDTIQQLYEYTYPHESERPQPDAAAEQNQQKIPVTKRYVNVSSFGSEKASFVEDLLGNEQDVYLNLYVNEAKKENIKQLTTRRGNGMENASENDYKILEDIYQTYQNQTNVNKNLKQFTRNVMGNPRAASNEGFTMRPSRSKPSASMAFNEGTCDEEEEKLISIDHTQFDENASIVQYLCHFLLSEPSKDLSRIVHPQISKENMCFLQRCRIKNEKHRGDQMYREMNNEDVERLNDIIVNLRAKTKQKIKQNMEIRERLVKQAINRAKKRNAMRGKQPIRGGGNRKRRSLKRIMKNMPSQKRIRL